MEEMLLSLVTFEAFLRLPGSQLGQPELCQKAPVSCRHTSSQLSNPLPPDIIYAQRNDPSQPLSQPTSRTLMTLRVSLRIYNSVRYSHLLTDRLALPAPHTHTPPCTADASPQPISSVQPLPREAHCPAASSPSPPEGPSGQQRWLCSFHNSTVGAGMHP